MTVLFGTNDRLLLRFVRTGDTRALARLFDRTAPELLRIAAWLSGNRADAEDLLQRTFVTVIEARANYDATRRALPWLVGILGNHARKWKEQRARHLEARPPRDEPDPFVSAGDAEFAAAVEQLRAQLGTPYAEVLDLHLAHDLNAKQIAERLGRPAGTVRTQLVRGLELLRRHLPHGFVAGLLFASTARAASLAAVRAAIVQHSASLTSASSAAATTALATTGTMLMTKKLAVSIPALLLLLGGGAWWIWPSKAREVAGASPAVAARAAVPDDLPGAIADANALAVVREQVVAQPPERVVPEPGFAALVVRLKWSHDGSPAARVAVCARPRPGTYVHECEGLTGDDGEVVLRRIRPGHCWVTSSFTSLQQLDLAVDETRVLEAVATRENRVRGHVIDADGQAVADARIWVSDSGTWARGFEVTRSDGAGAFELALGLQHYLGARKVGHAPSLLQTRQQGDTRDIVLRMRGPGGSLRGHVLDRDGRAVANAVIDVGMLGGWVVPGSTIYEHFVQPIPQRTVSAADGAFRVEGIEPGGTNVKVWAAGYALICERAAIEAGTEAQVTIVLPEGAVVEGTVRDAGGRAVADASVATEFDVFHTVATRSDTAGGFRLADLPPGPRTLTAVLGDTKVTASLELVAGQTSRWQPVLQAARVLRGRVLGPDGKGVADLQVGTAAAVYPTAQTVATTDATGAFEVRNLDEGPLDVLVQTADMVLLRQPLPDERADRELFLTLHEGDLPTAVVRGRVIDREGSPIAARFGMLALKFGGGPAIETRSDGTFECEPSPAGDYQLSVEARGYGRRQLGTVTLCANEHRTLPDIVLEPAGRAEIALRVDEAPRYCQVKLVRDDGVCAGWVATQGKLASSELPPGSYVAVAQLEGTMVAATGFVVRSNETTAVDLFFVAATKVDITCRGNGSLTKDHRLRTIVRAAAGNIVDAGEHHCRHAKDLDSVRVALQLQPGTYSLEILVSDGRSVSHGFTVTTGAQPAQNVDLPSR